MGAYMGPTQRRRLLQTCPPATPPGCPVSANKCSRICNCHTMHCVGWLQHRQDDVAVLHQLIAPNTQYICSSNTQSTYVHVLHILTFRPMTIIAATLAPSLAGHVNNGALGGGFWRNNSHV